MDSLAFITFCYILHFESLNRSRCSISTCKGFPRIRWDHMMSWCIMSPVYSARPVTYRAVLIWAHQGTGLDSRKDAFVSSLFGEYDQNEHGMNFLKRNPDCIHGSNCWNHRSLAPRHAILFDFCFVWNAFPHNGI